MNFHCPRIQQIDALAKQKTSQNADDLEKLADQINELTDVLKKSMNAGTPSKSMLDRIDHLSR